MATLRSDVSILYPALAAVFALLLHQFVKRRNSRVPLPPGPPADPIINHLRVIPTKNHPQAFHEWTKAYGDVVYVNALGKSFIILGSEEAASDLLDKRSANYSDRPQFPMQDLIGWSDMVVFLNYGDQFNKMRKLSSQPFTRQGSLLFQDIQLDQAHILLYSLLESPFEYWDPIQRFATAIVMDIAYGHRIVDNGDPYLRMADRTAKIALELGNLGTHAVDIFPFLKHLPAWFPGAGFIRYCQETGRDVKKVRDWPFQEVRKQLAAGKARKSFVAMHLEDFARDGAESPKNLDDLAAAATFLNLAGGETTSSSILMFVMAMQLYPEAQRKAQKEIDEVIGPNRLPDFSDRESLPMVECVIQEVLRLYNPIPLGVPHCARADDVYKGMFIPKGALVVANTLSLALDEKVYANPYVFWPERYLPKPEGNGEPHPPGVFGYGRRICPGRFLANASVWIAITTILATFDIKCPQDERGKEIIPTGELDTGATRRPKPFKCQMKIRSSQAEKLIRNAHQDFLKA
ncbi:hypothetical protein NLI96_g261 [Meripilus lineatus]|uniref:Cytochrome P450 n=1 Tax=Meripilus lineatus TaxID=2056292 RepID=A0AAD5YIM0_9APHY|nr:hypothetical protein NLI96_g261 [Physisporinus lineatus]